MRYLLTFLLLLSLHHLNAQNHQSRNDHTGNWEDAATWSIGNGTLANNDVVNIYGWVKRNSTIVLNNGIDLHVYDTLFIYGDLDIRQNGFINVHTGGMVVVFGNVIAYNNVDIDLSSYFVVLGNFDQRNGSTVTAPANDTLLYITGTPICGGTATCLPSDLVGGLDDLLNNPALGDLILGYSSIIIAPTTFICPGQSVQLNIRSDGSNYQWYRGTTAIAGATSASYNAVV